MAIAIGRDQAAWFIEEVTPNTAVWPTSANCVPIIGDAQFKQVQEMVDSDEKVMSFSRTDRDATGYNPGEFSFDMKVRPSGTAGVAPVGGVLLKSLFGKETTVTDTSVTYGLATVDDDITTFSALVKDGHDVTLCTGCYVSKGTFPVKATTGQDGIGKASLSGGFLRKYRAGTDMLNAAIDGTVTPVTAIVLKTAGAYKRFDAGIKIIVGTDDNSGAGYLVTAVTPGTNTLTISGGVATEQAADAVVKGWTPAVATSGVTCQGAYGYAQLNKAGGSYANVNIIEATVDIDNGIHALREKNDTAFPSAIAWGNRIVTAKINRFFTEDGSDLEYDSLNQVAIGLKLPCGNTAGDRYRLELPNCEADSPTLSGDLERIIEVNLNGLATASLDDELSMIFD